MTIINIDLSNVQTDEGFDTLPPGWYEAEVEDSEIKNGKNAEYIQWTFSIISKPNKVWDIMSFSEKAYPITQKRLKSLAIACGHHNPNYVADTEELHGCRLLIRLKIDKDVTGQYGDKNKITDFKPLAGGGVAMTIPPAAAESVPEVATPVDSNGGPPPVGTTGGNGGNQALMPWER
jgi:hypothetical protein